MSYVVVVYRKYATYYTHTASVIVYYCVVKERTAGYVSMWGCHIEPPSEHNLGLGECEMHKLL